MNLRTPLLILGAAGLVAVAAGCGSSDSSSSSASTARKADNNYALPLVVNNNLPVDIQVTPQDPQGPWQSTPAATRTTIADGESTTLRLRPRTYWSQRADDWGTLTPGPRMSLSVVQRGTQDAAALPMSIRYKIQRINPVDGPTLISAWGLSWAFGTSSDKACGPASPAGVSLAYTDPATSKQATARIAIDCPSSPRSGNPPTTLSISPQG